MTLFDALTGAVRQRIQIPADAFIDKLSFSATGDRLSVAPIRHDGSTLIYEAASGKLSRAWRDDVLALVGDKVLERGEGRKIDWRDLFSGNQVHSIEGRGILASPDGKLVAVGAPLRLVDATTAKVRRNFDTQGTPRAFSIDGQRLFTIDGDRGELWQCSTGERLADIRNGLFHWANYVALLSDQRLALSPTLRNPLVVLDLSTGKTVASAAAHLDSTPDIRLGLGNADVLLTYASDGVRFHRIADLAEVGRLVPYRDGTYYVRDAEGYVDAPETARSRFFSTSTSTVDRPSRRLGAGGPAVTWARWFEPGLLKRVLHPPPSPHR